MKGVERPTKQKGRKKKEYNQRKKKRIQIVYEWNPKRKKKEK